MLNKEDESQHTYALKVNEKCRSMEVVQLEGKSIKKERERKEQNDI